MSHGRPERSASSSASFNRAIAVEMLESWKRQTPRRNRMSAAVDVAEVAAFASPRAASAARAPGGRRRRSGARPSPTSRADLELGVGGRGDARWSRLRTPRPRLDLAGLDQRLGAGERGLDAVARVRRDAVGEEARIDAEARREPLDRLLRRARLAALDLQTYSLEKRSPARSVCVRPAATRSWRRRSPRRVAAACPVRALEVRAAFVIDRGKCSPYLTEVQGSPSGHPPDGSYCGRKST